jgi:predicted house-cleaning noncanonical NTP pyrophosphatase (MazG superfamily)
LLDFAIVAIVSRKTEDQIKEIILESIRESRNKILKKNKFFAFLFDGLTLDHIAPDRLALLDASEIIDSITRKLGLEFDDYLEAYTKTSLNEGRLRDVFPGRIVEIMAGAKANQNADRQPDEVNSVTNSMK